MTKGYSRAVRKYWGLTAEEGRELLIEDGLPTKDNHHVRELEIPENHRVRIRIGHAFLKAKIQDLNTLCELTKEEILQGPNKWPNFGTKSLSVVEEALSLMGKHLKDAGPRPDPHAVRSLGISAYQCKVLERGGILSFTKLCDQTAPDLMKLGLSFKSVQHIRECVWKTGTDLKPDSPFYRRTPEAEAVVRSGRINCPIENLVFGDANLHTVRHILNRLRHNNLMDTDAVCARTEHELLLPEGFERKILNVLKEALARIGREIGDNLPVS